MLLALLLVSWLICVSSATDNYEVEEIYVIRGNSAQLLCSSQHIGEHLVWRWRPFSRKRTKMGNFQDIEEADVGIREHFTTNIIHDDEQGNLLAKLTIENFTRKLEGDYECMGNKSGSWKVYNFTSLKLTYIPMYTTSCGISSALNSLSCSIDWREHRSLFEENEWFCFLERKERSYIHPPNVCASHKPFVDFSNFSNMLAEGNGSRCMFQLADNYTSHADISNYYFYITFMTATTSGCYNKTEVILPHYHIIPPMAYLVEVEPIFCKGIEEYGFNITWKTDATTKVPFTVEIHVESLIPPFKVVEYFVPGDSRSDIWSCEVCGLLPDNEFSVTVVTVLANLKQPSYPVWSKTLGLNTSISDASTSPTSTSLSVTNETTNVQHEEDYLTLLYSRLFIVCVVIGVILCLAVALAGHVWDQRRRSRVNEI